MMKLLYAYFKTAKLYLLKTGMVENDKYACRLLLSVILLAGTVTGISRPLKNSARIMADQTRFMRKEFALYREFAAKQNSEQKQVQQQNLLQKLKRYVPEEIDPEEEVQRIYQMAGLRGITVLRFKQITDNPVHSPKTGDRINRLIWETEFSGTWHDLISFFNDIETQSPCTRMEALQIRKSGETGKNTVSSGAGRGTELSVRGRICVYYCCKKTTA